MGMGTWQTFDVGSSVRERAPVRDVLDAFVARRGAVVDLSPMYGRAEEVLGQVAAEASILDRLFIATKVWTTGRAEGIAQMEDSCRLLGGRIDLMQVHNLLDVDVHLETLREWKAAGRIRYIGITHYQDRAHDALVKQLEGGGIDFVQANYSIADRNAEKRLLPAAAANGVAFMVNRPLGTGKLIPALARRPMPPIARELKCETWSELVLKYVVSHPAVTVVIPATSKVAHMNANMNAGDAPLPDEAQRACIVAELSR